MRTEGLSQCLGSDVRNGERRRVLPELDLNYPPHEGIVAANCLEFSAEVHNDSQKEIGDCVEVIDDDLAIINQRIFAEAKNNSRRNYSRVTNELRDVLIEAGGLLNSLSEMAIWFIEQSRNIRDEATPCEDFIMNAESINNNQMINLGVPTELPKTPMSEAPTFSCPICMGPLIEATTTKCGHIFCKECIKTAITAQGKCPNCRRKLGKRGIIRVYLPTPS